MEKPILICALATVFINSCFAQGTDGVIIDPNNTTTRDVSAVFQAQSTSQGVLLPRMTSAERLLIPVNAARNGLLVYQTSAPAGFYYYDGGQWLQVGSTTGTGSSGHVSFWNGTSSQAYDSDANFVWDDANNRLGIGIAAPTAVIDIQKTAPAVNEIIFRVGTDADANRFRVDEDGDIFTAAAADIGSDVIVRGSDVYDNSGPIRLSGEDDVNITMDYNTDDDDISGGRLITMGKNSQGTPVPLMQIQESGTILLNTYTTNGLLKTTGANGTLAVATPGTDYLTNNQTITLTGNVTGSGTTSIATTIANDAVTNTGLANMAANTVKVNATAAAADPTDLAIGTNNVLGRLAANIVAIPIGTAANTIAAGNHTHATLSQGSGITTFSYTGAAAATVGIATGGVTSTHIADNTITSADIFNGTIAAADMADNSVTNAKLADMAVNTIKGRITAGTGDPEDLTATQVKTILGLTSATTGTGTTNGVTYWASASTLGSTALGGAGTVLHGTGAAPSFSQVVSADILNGTIANADIANNAVNGAKIAMGSDATGDILYYNGTDYVRLPAGTSGRFLRTNGVAAPSWETVPAGATGPAGPAGATGAAGAAGPAGPAGPAGSVVSAYAESLAESQNTSSTLASKITLSIPAGTWAITFSAEVVQDWYTCGGVVYSFNDGTTTFSSGSVCDAGSYVPISETVKVTYASATTVRIQWARSGSAYSYIRRARITAIKL